MWCSPYRKKDLYQATGYYAEFLYKETLRMQMKILEITLQQAVKIQRGSRGYALLFL
jgi:hypothetical protein